jgi:hypothetical protein
VTRAKLKVILYLWLYAGWFACVLLGKADMSVLSLAVPAMGWLLFWKALSPSPGGCVKLLVLCAGGMLVDALLMKGGVARYIPETGTLPLWMVSLWLLFAPAMYIFAGLFGRRLWLAALAGGIFGPLGYKSGEAFGVLELQGLNAFVIYAIFWALFLPLAIAAVSRDNPSISKA